ncbi:MAG TPA: Ig-like domain repeat protein [Candidatus Diapherotrites archaeon]|nr:Ig-like domain repeat protein [Candidatus Diapherotrites archaeon]
MSKPLSKILLSLSLIFILGFVFAEPSITVNPLVTKNRTPDINGAFDLNGLSGDANFIILINSISYTSLDSNVVVNYDTNTWSLTTLELADGNYDVNAMMTIGDNTYYDVTINELIIDNNAPTISLNTVYTNHTIHIDSNANDAGSGIATYYWSTLDENVNISTPNLESTDINASSDGNYTITLTVTDRAGNTQSADFNFIWDTVKPDISDINDYYTNATITVDANATDYRSGIASYQWSASPLGISFSDDDSNVTTITASADGNYHITLTVTDRAGNTGYEDFYFVWDTTPPTISLNTVYTNQTIHIDSNAIDDGSGIETYHWSASDLNVTISTPDLNSTDINASSDGNYAITLTVTDRAGNTQSANFNFIWDTVKPDISDINGYYTNATITVDANATDDRSGIASYLWTADSDNVIFSDYNADVTDINATSDGNYTITLTVTDRAGNSKDSNFYFVWDTTAPILTKITIPNRYKMILSFDDEDINFDCIDENTKNKIVVNGIENAVSSLDVDANNNLITIYFSPAFALFTDVNDSFKIDENAFVDILGNKSPLIDASYLASNTTIDDNALPFSYIDTNNNDENHVRVYFTENLNLDTNPPNLEITPLVDGNDLNSYYLTIDVNTDYFSATYHNDENGYYIDFVTTNSYNGAKIIIDKIGYSLVDDSNNPYTPFYLVLDNNKWSFQRIVDNNYVSFEHDDSSYTVVIPSFVDSNSQVIFDLSEILDTDNNSVIVPEDGNFFFERQTTTTKHSVTIYSDTNIMGVNGWDGNLILPTVTDNYDIGDEGTSEITITLGLDENKTLLFSKAVKIIIGGMAGKKAGYVLDGNLYEIYECDENQLSDPDTYLQDLNSENYDKNHTGDCYTSEDGDLVIWTKHFTDFTAYTPATSGGGGTGGGGGGSGGGSTGEEEEEEEEKARCSDLKVTTTSITTYSDSTVTKSIAITNDSSFNFNITNLSLTQASGLDITIKEKPTKINDKDSEYLRIEIVSDVFDSTTTRTIKLQFDGKFTDKDKTSCSKRQDISVKIQEVSEEDDDYYESSSSGGSSADNTNNTTYKDKTITYSPDTNTTTNNDTNTDKITDTTGVPVITAVSGENQESETSEKKKSNTWLFWLLDLSILVVIIAIILIVIKKRKNPKRNKL